MSATHKNQSKNLPQVRQGSKKKNEQSLYQNKICAGFSPGGGGNHPVFPSYAGRSHRHQSGGRRIGDLPSDAHGRGRKEVQLLQIPFHEEHGRSFRQNTARHRRQEREPDQSGQVHPQIQDRRASPTLQHHQGRYVLYRTPPAPARVRHRLRGLGDGKI